MADPEPPKSKYQCLVDAVTDAGVASKLPPIMPGTEVEDLSGRPSGRVTPPRSNAEFAYQGTDGFDNFVYAADGLLPDQTNPGTQLFRHKNFQILTPYTNPSADQVMSSQNMETGEEVNLATRAKPGTVGETVDKIIKCRTPELS